MSVEYAEDVSIVFNQRDLRHRLFADHMHGYFGGRPHDADATARRLERCVADVTDWCRKERFQLNADETELLWFGPTSLLQCLSPYSKIINVSKPASFARNPSVLFDADYTPWAIKRSQLVLSVTAQKSTDINAVFTLRF